MITNEIPDELKYGVRLLMLLHRKKDGGEAGNGSGERRRISFDVDEYDEHVKYLVDYADAHPETPWRLYASINPRDPLVAMAEVNKFHLNMLTGPPRHTELQIRKYLADPKGRIISELAKRSGAASVDVAMVDVDNDGPIVTSFNRGNLAPVIALLPTPNGYHWILPRSELEQVPEYLRPHIKRDGLFLVGWKELQESK